MDDEIGNILKVSEGRWQIEDCFRIMKTDFSARPVYVQRKDHIKAHFLICFLALLNYRLLSKGINITKVHDEKENRYSPYKMGIRSVF